MIYIDINSPILSPHGMMVVLLLVALWFTSAVVVQNMEKNEGKKKELSSISRQF